MRYAIFWIYISSDRCVLSVEKVKVAPSILMGVEGRSGEQSRQCSPEYD